MSCLERKVFIDRIAHRTSLIGINLATEKYPSCICLPCQGAIRKSIENQIGQGYIREIKSLSILSGKLPGIFAYLKEIKIRG